jgi:hypothetical protein
MKKLKLNYGRGLTKKALNKNGGKHLLPAKTLLTNTSYNIKKDFALPNALNRYQVNTFGQNRDFNSSVGGNGKDTLELEAREKLLREYILGVRTDINSIRRPSKTAISDEDFNDSLENLVLPKINSKIFANDIRPLQVASEDKLLRDETFFSEYFLKKLGNLMENLRGKSLTIKQKQALQAKLDSLTIDDNELKYLFQKQHFEYKIHEFLPSDFTEFSKILKLYKHPNASVLEKSQRAYRNYLPYKFALVMKGFAKQLAGKYKAFDVVEELTADDYAAILSNIKSTGLFNDLLSMVFTVIRENQVVFEKNTGSLNNSDEAFVGKMSTIYYKYNRFFLIFMVNEVLSYINDKRQDLLQPKFFEAGEKQVLQVEHLVSLAHRFLVNNSKNYSGSSGGRETGSWYGISYDMTTIIVNMLNFTSLANFRVDWETGSTKNNRTKQVQVKKIVLPAKLETFVYSLTGFPRLAQPPKLDWDDVVGKVKPIFQGSFEMTQSDAVLATFNLLQKKKFKVNEIYLKLLQDFCSVDITQPCLYEALMSLDYDLPNKDTMNILREKKLTFKLLSSNNVLQNLTYTGARDNLKALNLGFQFYQPLKQITGYLPLEQHVFRSSMKIKQDEKSKHLRLRYVRTCMDMCTILMTFPIYFTNIFCTRLRFYPEQALLSRTSGILKHCIQDYQAIKLTNQGLVSLMRSYYFKDKALSLKFEFFIGTQKLTNKKTFFKVFGKFFEDNPITFTSTKSAPYFMLLHAEIGNALETRFTAVPIEIDQKASGITLLALLTRNKPLADKCNIINRENNDIYVYCQQQFEAFYNREIENKNDKVLQFFEDNRNNMKFAFMCYAYRQKTEGRFRDVYLTYWEETFFAEPSYEERQSLYEVAKKFEPFLESLFPKLTTQIALLEKIIGFVVSKNANVQITTYDGVKLTWDFFETVSQIRNAFNPHTGESQSYHVGRIVNQTLSSDDVENVTEDQSTPKRDKSKHVRCFLSYFIHSLDGAIIRIIAQELYKKTGYIANTLHDCILLHPNYVETLYEIIQELYSSKNIYNIAEDLIFSQLRSQISSEYYDAFDLMVLDYFEQCDDFEADIGNFEPRHLYEPE